MTQTFASVALVVEKAISKVNASNKLASALVNRNDNNAFILAYRLLASRAKLQANSKPLVSEQSSGYILRNNPGHP